MTSVEKVRAMLDALRVAEPTSEDEARELAMLGTIVPIALGYLPDRPAELDSLLAKGARFCLAMRSDDAPPIDELDESPLPLGLAVPTADEVDA